MGIGGMGIWQLVIILVIVLLLFGTKRLKGLGGDLGSAIKGFKKAMGDEKKDISDADIEAEDELKKVADEEAEPAPAEEAQKSETKS